MAPLACRVLRAAREKQALLVTTALMLPLA
jgi:hypothetical protein